MNLYSIIVIYNGMRRDWIQKCFSSIEASSVPVKIIAIDNASTDDSVHYIKANFPNVLLIESKENLGFGGANNLGLKKALDLGGEYFFLLNQDARVEKDTLEKLVTQAQNNPEYGIISPLHLNGKGDALDYNFSNYISPSQCKNLYSDFVLNKVENKIYESGFICAAAWLLTKTSLKTVGGFSPTFFHYAEDDNYIHRLKFKKLKIGVYPHTFIFHDREERANTKFHSAEEQIKREWALRISNPLQETNIHQYKKQLKNKLLKNRIFRNTSEVKRIKKELFLLENLENLSVENYKKSISSAEFIFLT